MPAPTADDMSKLARAKFTSFALKVPANWSPPQGDAANQYNNAFKDSEKSTAPGAPPLFQPASMNKYHTDTQKMHIAKIGGFIDDTMKAIANAWANWQKQAMLVGLIVTGPAAIGGKIVGPPMTPLIQGPKSTAALAKYSSAIAEVIGAGWDAFIQTVLSPGLLFYPGFAVATAPTAALPTENAPFPFAALTQVPLTISSAVMKPLMIAKLGDPQAPFHKELFEAITDAFEKTYSLWKVSCMIKGVKGMGPVPTFVPPTPVPGPVVGGVAAMMGPGGFT